MGRGEWVRGWGEGREGEGGVVIEDTDEGEGAGGRKEGHKTR